MAGAAPSVWYEPPIGGAEVLAAEHRRRLKLSQDETAALVLAQLLTSSFCTADTSVSSSTFVAVTGMSQSFRAVAQGDLELRGVLYVQEVTPGQLSIRVLQGSTVLWSATVREQGCVLLTGTSAQLGQWLVPFGGPGLLSTSADTSYDLVVEIAAPAGSYTVLTGTGKESWMTARVAPTVTI